MKKVKEKFDLMASSIKDENKKNLLLKAFNFAKKAHKWQKRKTWDDYLIHPLEVAIALWDKFEDLNLTIAWFLHDTVEDNENIKMPEIYEQFWKKIWFIVDSATKNEEQFYKVDLIFEKKIDKILCWWMDDIRCFLLKIADRENNLKTLYELKDNKQLRIAFETQAIFNPLSEILFSEKNPSIVKIENIFNSFLKENKIKDYLELKEFLIKETFDDFTEDTFDLIYKKYADVLWRIEDENIYKKIINISWIDKKIDFKLIEVNNKNYFSSVFKFKKWHSFDFSDYKFILHKEYY